MAYRKIVIEIDFEGDNASDVLLAAVNNIKAGNQRGFDGNDENNYMFTVCDKDDNLISIYP